MIIKRKWIGICGAIVLGISATVTVAVLLDQPAPPPEVNAETTQESAEYLASEDFKKLPEKKKEKFVAEIFRSGQGRTVMREARKNMSEEQRQEFRRSTRSMFRKRMEKRMDDYFKLPPDQRLAQLDKMIDRMQERRNRPRRARDNSDGNRRRGRGWGRRGRRSPERMKRRIERTSPERRAKFVEFHKAMRKRMKERGIEPRRGRWRH